MTNAALRKRRLGRTNLEVTPLGLGGAHLGRLPDGFSDERAVAAVHYALESGINLIDTSPMYGESQRRIGLALDDWYGSGGRREDIVICTKTGHDGKGGKDFSADGTRRSVEESLRLLRTDYLDILLVHDPDDLGPVLGPAGTLEALQELKEQGVIRAIGLGARPHDFHRRCIQTGEFDVSLTFCDYNLLDQSAAKGVLEVAAAHDVGVFNAAAVMLGLLGGRDPREIAPKLGSFATPERLQRAGELWDWSQSRGLSLLALNLQFCLREPRIASTLLGVSHAARLESDLEAISADIPDAVWQELHERFGIP